MEKNIYSVSKIYTNAQKDMHGLGESLSSFTLVLIFSVITKVLLNFTEHTIVTSHTVNHSLLDLLLIPV